MASDEGRQIVEVTHLSGDVTPLQPGGETPIIHDQRDNNLEESDATTDSDDETVMTVADSNPEPPRELLENHLIDADNIGDTVFSKHWLFTILMKLIQAVDREEESKEQSDSGEYGLDVDDTLQDELCKLWDISMNPEVVIFLQEFKAIDLLLGVIKKSRAPRIMEICVGILANMACDKTVCKLMSANEKLVEIILMLLETPDAPTLVETTRLLRIAVSSAENASSWISAIKAEPSVFENLSFILKSSTNEDLLRNTGQLVEILMDVDESLCEQCSSPDFLSNLLEALRQTKNRDEDIVSYFFHILQLMSTNTKGAQALVEQAEELMQLTVKYLVQVGSEEVVLVEGRESSLASVLSVFNIIYQVWSDRLKVITQDYQFMRCTLKILEVVYPRCYELDQADLRKRSRSSSIHSPKRTGRTSQSESCDADEEQTKITESPSNGETETEEFDLQMTQILNDALQTCIVQIVTSFAQLAEKSSEEESVPCKTLEYLDSSCPRPRLKYVILTLQKAQARETTTDDSDTGTSNETTNETTNGSDVVHILEQTAKRFNLHRLLRILDDTIT